MAVVDADGSFISIDVGAPGGGADSGVFSGTPLGQSLADGSVNLPIGEYNLPNSTSK